MGREGKALGQGQEVMEWLQCVPALRAHAICPAEAG